MTSTRVSPSIAITGASAICAVGTDRHAAVRRILSGETGFSEGDGLENHPEDNPRVAQALDLDEKIGCRPDRAERYLQQAIKDAIEDGGWTGRLPERTAVVLGTTLGGIRHFGDGLRRKDIKAYARLNNSSVSRYSLEGTGLPLGAISLSAACASGLTAIINGALLLESGEADLVIAGGYDPISEFSLGGFMSLRLVAPDRTMPFEADRVGMKVGEGYGVVILERVDDAERRGAGILGLLDGSGECSDAYHLTQPQPEGKGAARAMASALTAGTEAPPGWILAHATATPANDGAEYAAYERALGTDLEKTPITALKSRLGHTLGAAGALELVLGLTALDDAKLLTTADGTTDTENFPRLNLLRGEAPNASVDRLAILSLGFGGADACLTVNRAGTPAPTRRVMEEDVVLTGIGALLPGIGARSGPASGQGLHDLAGSVENSALEGLDDPRATRRLAQISCLARAVGRLAVDDAELTTEELSSSDALIGSFHGAIGYSLDYYSDLIESGIEHGNPLMFAESVPNIGSAQASLALGIGGATLTVIGSRTAALEALHLARLRIQNGLAERALVIGVEESHSIIREVMELQGLLLRPDGSAQTVGSGAIAFVLEGASAARARDAKVVARLADTGLAWPSSNSLSDRIRAGRALLRRSGGHPPRTTESPGPIGKIELAIASPGSKDEGNRSELGAIGPLASMLEAIEEGVPAAVVAADFQGTSGLIVIEPC